MKHMLVVALLLASAAPAAAQSFVYALESGTQPFPNCAPGCHPPTVHLINAATGHDLATISVGTEAERGTAIALSSDGRLLLVTTVSQVSPVASGTLWVMDALSRTVLGQVPVGLSTVDVAILPDSTRAYVVNGQSVSSQGEVRVVDLTTLTVAATIPVAQAFRIVVAPNGTAAYVMGNGAVSKISAATNAIETTIGVGSSPSGIDISPDGSRIFVANSGGASVSVIDANFDSVLRMIPAGSSTAPPRAVSAQSATRIFVTLSGSVDTVQLLNAADGAVLGSTSALMGWRYARDASGTPTYVVELATRPGGTLRRVAPDGSSTTALATAASWNGAAVLTDPCTFEATASSASSGPAGGSGTLTIPAPAGCSWSIDPSGAPGFLFSGTFSGTGPATRSFTVGASTTPRLGTVVVGRQVVTLEQTIPRLNIDSPVSTGAVLTQPFTISGWAIDQNLGAPLASRARGIDVLHVWAYPASGAPIMLGTATPGLARPDVGSTFGSSMTNSGFNFIVRTLVSGTYTIVVYAHSEISNQFVTAQAVNVTVQGSSPRVFIDGPANGAIVGRPFQIGGWALDPAALSGTGVDAIHVWAYPSSGAPVFVGVASYGGGRPDVASLFGAQFQSSGYSLQASLAPGRYTLVVFARSTVTGAFTAQTAAIVVPDSEPAMVIDAPGPGIVGASFDIVGWALDRGVTNGNSTDFVHVWAYPVGGAAPTFVGAAQRTARPDVAAVFGATHLFAGFSLRGSLPTGTYDLVVFARSVLTQTFNNVRVVRITVQ